MVTLEYDDGSGAFDRGYYVQTSVGQLGPLTTDELNDMYHCLHTHFEGGGEAEVAEL